MGKLRECSESHEVCPENVRLKNHGIQKCSIHETYQTHFVCGTPIHQEGCYGQREYIFIKDPRSWHIFAEHMVPNWDRIDLELKYLRLIKNIIRIYEEPGERTSWRIKKILNKHINPE